MKFTAIKDFQRKMVRLVRIGPDSSISKNVDRFKLSSLATNHVLKESGLTTTEEFKNILDKCLNVQQFLKKNLGHRYFYRNEMREDILLARSNVICTHVKQLCQPSNHGSPQKV
ncbi:hypothetical protein NQ318_000139 [Aromia moschata]|uniref:Ribosomal protein S13 n=1 Tax=Aromia moschata TaxID=1265417 RepID=A0AAV8XIU0_9CUCU|nr:hypothetical protein NQ318_000139 [Aromia moschata]